MRIVELKDLRAIADRYLQSAREQLLEHRGITPVVVLSGPADERPDEVIVLVDPQVMNSSDRKEAFAQMIKERIRDGGFTATLFMSDTYMLRTSSNAEASVVLVLSRHGLGCREIAAMGIGHVYEAITVTLESITGHTMILQMEYTRDADGKVTGFKPVEDAGKMGPSRFKFFDTPDPELPKEFSPQR